MAMRPENPKITLPSGKVLEPNFDSIGISQDLQLIDGCGSPVWGVGLHVHAEENDDAELSEAPVADKLFLAKLMMTRWMDYYVAAIDEELAKK